MGPEKGCVVGDFTGEAQSSNLVGDRQPVATLNLDGRRALGARLSDKGAEPHAQLVVARRAGCCDRGTDAARRVGAPGHAGHELIGAITRKDKVAVAVDEAGNNRGTRSVDARVGGGSMSGVTGPHNTTVSDHKGGIEADGSVGIGGIERDELADVLDDQTGGGGAHEVILPGGALSPQTRPEQGGSPTRQALRAHTARRAARCGRRPCHARRRAR